MSTFIKRWNLVESLVRCKRVRQPYIPIKDEEALVSTIHLKAKQGFGLKRADIKDLVTKFVDYHKQQKTELGAHLRKYCKFKVKM